MNDLLQWEIDWINAHPELYEGPWHRKAVIGNITKMYQLREVKKFIDHFAKKKFLMWQPLKQFKTQK